MEQKPIWKKECLPAEMVNPLDALIRVRGFGIMFASVFLLVLSLLKNSAKIASVQAET